MPSERLTEVEFAKALAIAADADPDLVTDATARAHHPVLEAEQKISYLPIAETTLERFVRESRIWRCSGDRAVSRRTDDTRLEET
jgi:hypothetical protein